VTDIVARQLAKKMKLEDRLKPKLRQFFDQISSDVGAIFSATRNIPSLNSFNLELVAILRDHYRAIARQFDTTTRDDLKSAHLRLETKQEENIDKDIVGFINIHSQQQADQILLTTERNLQSIEAKIVNEANTSGIIVATRNIGSQIQSRFNENSDNRINTISATETQTVSETIKLLEASTVAAIISLVPGTQEMFKTWNTVLDEKTRLSHVLADRQRVRANQPFRVQGQNLKVPGDMSLGATIDNIAGCRCVAVFNVVGQESAPLDIPRGLL